MLFNRLQADNLFRRHPDYPSVQVELHDKSNTLLDDVILASNPARSVGRAAILIKFFDIYGAGYLRLVDDINFHEAYSHILDDAVRNTWALYADKDGGLFSSLAFTDQAFVNELRLRERYWKIEGFRRIEEIRKATNMRVPTPHPQPQQQAEPIEELQVTPKGSRRSKDPNPQVLEGRETVTRKEAADALGVTTRTIDRFVEDNKLHPSGAWGRKRFTTKELREFMNRKKNRRARQKKTK
jgi:hypothetical protein